MQLDVKLSAGPEHAMYLSKGNRNIHIRYGDPRDRRIEGLIGEGKRFSLCGDKEKLRIGRSAPCQSLFVNINAHHLDLRVAVPTGQTQRVLLLHGVARSTADI